MNLSSIKLAAVCFCAYVISMVILVSLSSAESNPTVTISNKTSLVHLGSVDSYDITEGGIEAASVLHEALEQKRPQLAAKALDLYNQLIATENFGGEYSALKWFCEYLLATDKRRAAMIEDPFVAEFYRFFAEKDYAILKDYLERKYHLKKLETEDANHAHRLLTFLEDFILCNNPYREQWERSKQMIELLHIKPGEIIADVGSGPGYYTFKFSRLTGPSGRVYAVDVNKMHQTFMRSYSQQNVIGNVEVLRTNVDRGIAQGSVDLVFVCSLYHNIYAINNEPEKDAFVMGLKNCLKDDGRLVIVDNTPQEDSSLPYHGPHIAKELIIGQLWHFGFELVDCHQVIPQRYMLIFKKMKNGTAGLPAAKPGSEKALPGSPGAVGLQQPTVIPILSKRSLLHTIPILSETQTHAPDEAVPDITDGGREAARLFYLGIVTKDPQTIRTARDSYEQLIPKEKFGDEYSAFSWFCDYLLAPHEERSRMLGDKFCAGYFEVFGGNDFEVLKSYVRTRYKLDVNEDGSVLLGKDQRPEGEELDKLLEQRVNPSGTDPIKVGSSLALTLLEGGGTPFPMPPGVAGDQMAYWRDFILFNNPRRETWERTSRIIAALDLRQGQSIADIGSGPGYYTFQFSQLVGPTGRVFAVETNKRHLDYIEKLRGEMGAANIQTVLSDLDDTKLLENSIDSAFLCSLYSIIYSISKEKVRDDFLASLRRALKPDGRLVIVDNCVVSPPDLPYHAPYMDKRLIIAQMGYHGFRLVDEHQFIPQRYMLIFQKADIKGPS